MLNFKLFIINEEENYWQKEANTRPHKYSSVQLKRGQPWAATGKSHLNPDVIHAKFHPSNPDGLKSPIDRKIDLHKTKKQEYEYNARKKEVETGDKQRRSGTKGDNAVTQFYMDRAKKARLLAKRHGQALAAAERVKKGETADKRPATISKVKAGFADALLNAPEKKPEEKPKKKSLLSKLFRKKS